MNNVTDERAAIKTNLVNVIYLFPNLSVEIRLSVTGIVEPRRGETIILDFKWPIPT